MRTKLTERYKNALELYLEGGGEVALQAAYEMGRSAIVTEMGSVDLMAIHQEALLEILRTVPTRQDALKTVEKSWQFLMESLSPFEMTVRGYRDILNTLRVSEERFKTLSDTTKDVIYSFSPDGTIKSLNPVFEEITGYDRSEWIGKSFAPLVHPDDLLIAQSVLRRIMKGETPPAFQMRIRSKSGEYLPAEFIPTPQMQDGEVVGSFVIARDFTERTRAQEQLRALAKRVVNAQEEEGRRIARELHDDLCQWLTGMKLSLNTLEDEIPDEKTLRDELRTMKEQVNQRITEVRRMSAKLRPSTLDDFGLSVAVTRLCEDCERLHRLPVIFQTAGFVLERYDSEVEIALYRIVQESLSNIVKHSRATWTRVRLSHTQETLTLEIEDNGIGFNPEQVALLPKTEGHQLGLVSMKERSILLGGTFTIDSLPGKGTKISVHIPLGPSEP